MGFIKTALIGMLWMGGQVLADEHDVQSLGHQVQEGAQKLLYTRGFEKGKVPSVGSVEKNTDKKMRCLQIDFAGRATEVYILAHYFSEIPWMGGPETYPKYVGRLRRMGLTFTRFDSKAALDQADVGEARTKAIRPGVARAEKKQPVQFGAIHYESTLGAGHGFSRSRFEVRTLDRSLDGAVAGAQILRFQATHTASVLKNPVKDSEMICVELKD